MSPELRNREGRMMTSCSQMRLLKISPELLAITNVDRTSRLLVLPLEIMMLIFSHANLEDQVAIALSCKSLLRIAFTCHLQLPNPEAHRATWRRNPEQSTCNCGILPTILQRFRPRDARGRTSRSWTLCVDCLQYRPTRKAYWSRKLATLNIRDWGKPEGQMWQAAVKWFAMGVKLQCPPCHLKEHLQDQ
ncbi:hypothetical protein S40288_10927 [Stachybotrys chartarum IBT 40288]|nr:hypothetical protein S40288_10927 [Stachybotrys chartarum IBT 40288]